MKTSAPTSQPVAAQSPEAARMPLMSKEPKPYAFAASCPTARKTESRRSTFPGERRTPRLPYRTVQDRTSNSIERSLFLLAAIVFVLFLCLQLFSASSSWAAAVNIPGLQFDLDDAQSPQKVSGVLQIVFLLTTLSLAPAIFIMMTSFTRLAIVFAFLRQALGTQQSPPTQIIIGLALFLTLFIMQPVWQRINQEAIVPYQNHQLSGEEFLKKGMNPLKDFMLKHTRKTDLALFVSLSQQEKPKNVEALSITTIIPAFVISELRTAFQIGFLIYIPFIVLDMVVSSILLSMGMMMLPPTMISLPFKLMLFVLVDGWNLLIGSLIKSFQ